MPAYQPKYMHAYQWHGLHANTYEACMHHSKSLKLWQLPNDFHRELSKGARLLYARLMTLTNATN